MKDTDMLQAIYKATDNGMKIITYFIPEAEGCDRDGAFFRSYPRQRTPSCHLSKFDGVWCVVDFGSPQFATSPVRLCMKKERLEFRDALKHLYRVFIDPQWTGTVEVESDLEMRNGFEPSQPEPYAQTLAFRNGYFRVTADSVERTQVPPDRTVTVFPCDFLRLPSLFTAQDMPRRFDPKGDSSNMFRLVACTSLATFGDPDERAYLADFEERNLAAKLYAIGYLLHSYKDPAAKVGVWFHDADPDTDGCNGKSLVMRWLSMFRKRVTINGRDNKLTRRNYLFEKVNRNTGTVLFDDLMPHADTEQLRRYVTEGITIERKLCPETTLEYCEAPKIAVTAPYLPEERLSRTWLTCGFSDFFNRYYRPFEHFGMELMDAVYTQDDWNRDANFAVDCLRFYLKCRKDGITVREEGGTI